MIDTRTNNKHVQLAQINFMGVTFPAYIHNGVIYENRDDEPICCAMKDWELISTADHARLCEKWKL